MFLLSEHLAALYWQVEEQALAACQQILDLRQENNPLLRNLHAESLATRLTLDLVEHVACLDITEIQAGKTGSIQYADQVARAITAFKRRLDHAG